MERAVSRNQTQYYSRSLLAGLTQCLLLLICILALRFSTSTAQESSAVQESGAIPCTRQQDCSVGFRCSSTRGVCVRRTCKRDCSNTTEKLVCGSNGETYRNLCELKKAECLANQEIEVVDNGSCETLTPPPTNLCEEQQDTNDAFMNSEPELYNKQFYIVMAKFANGTLTFDDIHDYYRPTCTHNGYSIKQCYYDLCWCSTTDGKEIDGTLRDDMPDNFCALRNGCDGKYKDGEIFTPPSGCGLCECLDGEITCFEDFVPDTDGRLNVSQVGLLKEELFQIFFFQYNHDKHVIIDIRRFHKNPAQIPEAVKSRVLEWKFNYYDRNGDDELSSPEEHIFQMELYDYVKCKLFFSHIIQVIDTSNNGRISDTEWNTFFEMEHTSTDLDVSSASGTQSSGTGVQSRSIRQRRNVQRHLAHTRSKFQYVLL